MLKKYLNCCLSVESGCWTKLLPTVALQIHGGEFLSSFFQRYVPSHVVYCVCMDGMDHLDWISAGLWLHRFALCYRFESKVFIAACSAINHFKSSFKIIGAQRNISDKNHARLNSLHTNVENEKQVII